ncbi:hypothetical protein BCR39DRAFT_479075 [Naematelia encephala]|uniref:Amidohydrolase-related domain-containing protein n=1 Tax=Naematelia encephala TaxID=71784 RepID=A0A1Y2BBS2_9TREE|nr:hypothetical protein BCR39DRAFT_479075 [Naematelia encephala]
MHLPPEDQQEVTSRTHKTTIHTSVLFNSQTKTFDSNISIEVDTVTGLIIRVYQRDDERIHSTPALAGDKSIIDLRHLTVLPGFVDAHTHAFLHSYLETPSLNQERDESFVERVVRATNHCRAALKAGYTTYRDLGTEGLSDADVGLRDAINRGIIPGPRMFVVTDPIASTGSYAVRYESRLNGAVAPQLSDTCDGVDGVMAGVRKRIGAGADVIKFYADYRRRQLRFPGQAWPGCLPILHPPGQGEKIPPWSMPANPARTMWSQAEMNAIVEEAHRARAPVAAHAIEGEAIIMASRAGVTSIEHGYLATPDAIKAMKENNVIYVPTLSVLEVEKGTIGDEGIAFAKKKVKAAYDAGVRLACGGDTGASPHGQNIREVEMMVDAGIPVQEALRGATLGGWEACGGDWCGRRFGWIAEGCAADLVGLVGDPRQGLECLRKVKFVMKDGRVWVRDGEWIE